MDSLKLLLRNNYLACCLLMASRAAEPEVAELVAGVGARLPKPAEPVAGVGAAGAGGLVKVEGA